MRASIGPNPTLIRHDIIKRPRRPDENDLQFWRRVARTARRQLTRLETLDEYRFSHKSFAIRDALLLAECICGTGTFGVERIERGHNRRSPQIDYLNTGDTYATTVLFVRGQFRVGNWGDIVERGSYE